MIQLETFGGPELLQALGQLTPRVSKKVQKEAMLDAADIMRAEMARRAVRRPPHPDMADNMVASSARGMDAQEVVVAVGPAKRFFYASFVELGTASMPAQPFARPAFDATVSKVLRAFADSVWLALAGRGVQRSTVVSDAQVSGPGRLL